MWMASEFRSEPSLEQVTFAAPNPIFKIPRVLCTLSQWYKWKFAIANQRQTLTFSAEKYQDKHEAFHHQINQNFFKFSFLSIQIVIFQFLFGIFGLVVVTCGALGSRTALVMTRQPEVNKQRVLLMSDDNKIHYAT